MNIVVNGENFEFKEPTTLIEVIKSLKVESKVMAAAINMEIVKKDDWITRSVKEGDKIELLHFVGGG